MSGSFLLDTNAIINILKDEDFEKKFINEKFEFFISIITEIELLAFPSMLIEEENKIKELLNKIIILNINNEIKDETLRIRKKYNLKIPDAIICSTALIYNLNLVTDDKKLFIVKDICIKALKDLLS